MLQGILKLSVEDIPRGGSCEECPFRGSVTMYKGDDHHSFAACLLKGVIDSEGWDLDLGLLSCMKSDNSGRLSRDIKICNLNE